MSLFVYPESSRLAAIATGVTYVLARGAADRLAVESNFRVADMPMVIQAMTSYPEVRDAIRPASIDTITGECCGLRDRDRCYEVWHSVGSITDSNENFAK